MKKKKTFVFCHTFICHHTPCFLFWRGWGIQTMTLSDTCRLTTVAWVHGIDLHGWMMASARLAFCYSLQLTCELQPSDGSGQCRGTIWPKERTSSQPHSSSFHGQMHEQSGNSPPTTGHMSFSRLNSNERVIYIMAEFRSSAMCIYNSHINLHSASLPAQGAECEWYPQWPQHQSAPKQDEPMNDNCSTKPE